MRGSRTPRFSLSLRVRAPESRSAALLLRTTRAVGRDRRAATAPRRQAEARCAVRKSRRPCKLQGFRPCGAADRSVLGSNHGRASGGVTRAGHLAVVLSLRLPLHWGTACGGACPGPAGHVGAWALLTTPKTPVASKVGAGVVEQSPRSGIRAGRGEVVDSGRRTRWTTEGRNQTRIQGRIRGSGTTGGRRRWARVEGAGLEKCWCG